MNAAATADVGSVFDALASGTRREIVAHLARGSATTPEIARRFAFSKQALNRHIVALERAGVVERIRLGRVDRITLLPGSLDRIAAWIEETRRYWSANLDRLGAVLAEMNDGG